MNRAQFLEEVELYAALALSPEEMRECDAFLREDADEECRAALRRAQRAWAALSMSLEPVRPDERLWRAIERTLRGSYDAPASRGAARWRERLAWALVACAVLLLAIVEGKRGAALDRAARAEDTAQQLKLQAAASADQSARALTAERQQREACARELETARSDASARSLALAILQAPGARIVPLAPQAGASARATALLDLAGQRAALVASAMAPEAAHDYELWIIRGDEKIAAGLVKPDAQGTAILALDRSLLAGRIDAVAVTLEPAGGGAKPRGPIVLVAALKG